MRRLTDVLIRVLATTLLAAALAFAAYDGYVFQPRRDDIDALLTHAAPDERFPPESLAKLVRLAADGATSAHAARLLMLELPVPRLAEGTAGWHLTGMLWRALVALHLSEQTQIALIVARAPMGEHLRGFAAAAEARFQRPLGQLGVGELATLVAVSQAPSAAGAGLARRRNLLLLRLQRSG